MSHEAANTVNVWDILRGVDTPTVCNAIEIAKGRRQLHNFSMGRSVACVNTDYSPVVGFALTAAISASKEIEYDETVLAKRAYYYRYMAKEGRNISPELSALNSGEPPFVCVTGDLDAQPMGAFWGEVNVAIHRGMGLAGTLTNGLLRDLDALPEGYQVVAGGVGPSHAFVHVREVGVDVNVLGIDITPHDIIHADRHGAVKIEKSIFKQMPMAIAKVLEREEPVIAAAKKHPFNVEHVLKAMGIEKY